MNKSVIILKGHFLVLVKLDSYFQLMTGVVQVCIETTWDYEALAKNVRLELTTRTLLKLGQLFLLSVTLPPFSN